MKSIKDFYIDTDCAYMIRKPNTVLTAYDVVFIIAWSRYKSRTYEIDMNHDIKLTVSGYMIQLAAEMILRGEY